MTYYRSTPSRFAEWKMQHIAVVVFQFGTPKGEALIFYDQ